MKRLLLIAPIALFALAGCSSSYPSSTYGTSLYNSAPPRSMPSDNGGGPGPYDVPTNPSSNSGGGA